MMAAITDISDLVNLLTGGGSGAPERLNFFYDGREGSAAAGTPTANSWNSFWTWNKFPMGAGAVPTSAAVPTRATSGGLGQQNPGGSREKWLLGMEGVITVTGGLLLLYDRLLHCGGLSGTSTSPQTVGGTLTRNTGGIGNQIWVEIYTQIGTTATTITASYTNQDGTSGQTSKAASIGGSGLREKNRIIQIPLADGDTGVQAVASVTLAGTTGTAGDFGITIARPLFQAHGVANMPFTHDLMTGVPGFQKIDTDACLSLAMFIASANVPKIIGALQFVEK